LNICNSRRAGRAARCIISTNSVRLTSPLQLHVSINPPGSTSEVILLNDSTGVDVTGYRIRDVRPSAIPEVLRAYPRLDFKEGFAAMFVDQATRKPTCRVAEMVATGKLEAIAKAPFDS